MAKGTIPNNESPVTPSNAFQQQQQQPHASSSSGTDNNSSFVSVINNGYTAASREFERFFSSWGFNKRPNSAQASNVEPTPKKYHGKRKRDSNDSNNNRNNNSDEQYDPALYARIIPDENQQHVCHLSSSTHNNNNNTNKPLTTFEPHASGYLSNNTHNTHQHRHTFQYLVERQYSPPTRSKDTKLMETDQQHSSEYKVPANTTTTTTTPTRILNDNDTGMGTPCRRKSESTLNTLATPTRRRTMQPLYVPSATDTAKYANLDLLEEERLANLKRIIREAHSSVNQLLSIPQNSKSSRTVRFSPLVKHASIILPHIPRSLPPASFSSSSSYISPHRSSPFSPSSAYTRTKLSMPSENPSPNPRILTTTASPPRIKTELTDSPSPTPSSRFARDPFTTTTASATWGSIPKDDDKDDAYYRTDRIPLNTDPPSSRLTSLEPFSTSPTEMKTSSSSSSSSSPPPIHQRLSTFTQPSVDHLFEQQRQEQGSIVNGHQVLPTEQPPRKKPKTDDFDKEHKKTMGIIIHQIPKVKLRRTDTIRGPDGQMKPNPIWNEIYNNGKNKSRPL